MASPQAAARELTVGEVRLTNTIFLGVVNTSKVRVHNRPYFMGQGKGVAMTPNGEMWFHPEDHVPDFSINVSASAWFIHEMTHVWQYQSGRSVRARGLFEQAGRLFGADPYHYGKLEPGKKFTDYKNEQQASIVEDYYRVLHKMTPRRGSGTLIEYRSAIPFLPIDRSGLARA